MSPTGADLERPGVDLRPGRAFVCALHRHRDRVEGELNRRVLRRGGACPTGDERHGDRGRLDERCVVHLDGRADLVHGTRRLRLLDGLDRWLRAARPVARAVPAQVRQVHGSGFYRGPLLLADGTAGGSRLRDLRVIHLRSRPDARRRHRVLALPRRRDQVRRADRHGHRLLLCRAGRHEGDHLHSGGAVLCANFRIPGAGDLRLPAADRTRRPADRLRIEAGRRLGRVPA